jgi:hypothetical protein
LSVADVFHIFNIQTFALRYLLHLTILLLTIAVSAQQSADTVFSFRMYGDVRITFDQPQDFSSKKKTIIVFFALPNGNTTEQTMGKKMAEGDDWHFDIQHIRAQTKFLREKLSSENIVVIYLENDFKAWPMWTQKHADYLNLVQHIVDTLYKIVPANNKSIYLNGHSGGGRFIFDYLDGMQKIPAFVKRISFIDSNYGYDSSFYPKLKKWLEEVKHTHLTVFAYNDSVALYNGKPVVSATGGTWYRSHLMLNHFSADHHFQTTQTDSLIIFQTKNKKICFYLKQNLNRGIYHTQQVELNGFIHSILYGTKNESKGYEYYGPRAYSGYIK